MNPGTTANNAEDFTMTTATVTARDLFNFVSEGETLTTADGTVYIIAGDEYAGRFFLRADAFDAEVVPTDDDSDYADWCSRYAPTDAHEAELELAWTELDGGVEFDVETAIDRAADAWVEQGGERAIVDADVDAIAKEHGVRPAFVLKRAKAIGVPVL